MSASLVGSEMCIRDSACASMLTSARMHACTHGCMDAWAHGSMDALTPVSYTHLTLPTICSV
eukprot:12505778-Alexandrium_andersonii.AAC.1